MGKIESYGSWASPISIDLLLKGELGLDMPRWDGGDLCWLEGRPSEGGRQVVVRRTAAGVTSDVTPAGFNARTRVHEYGGGEYAVSGGVVWFANFDDQRIYRQQAGGVPQPITPAVDIRHADLHVDDRRRRIYAVREDHTTGAGEAVNTIVALDASGGRDAIVVASGNDFYSSPRLSADGSRLAWLTWNHPNMPWQACELWVGELDQQGAVRSSRRAAGGPGESICQPEWGPGGELYFVSDRSGWWNLYRLGGDDAEALCPMAEEFAGPAWLFGFTYYAVVDAGHILCLHRHAGTAKLGKLDVGTGTLTPIELLYADLGDIVVTGNRAALIAASPTLSKRILVLDLSSGAQLVAKASTDSHIDPGYISIPRAIEFNTESGQPAYALHYAPKNRDYEAPTGMKPPLIVHCHGGPTSAVWPTFDLELQYWTSRGFAYVDVNYGGSSGYGRAYRDRLKGAWGQVDVDDCINAAKHLVRLGHADPERVAITGGSAGGFTTLLALTKKDFFRAGASYYGIGDLVEFAKDTHKFESRYLDWLIGPYPERADLYRDRSAVNFADALNCPVILLQGLEDKVVPPSQAEEFVAACKAKKLPFAYIAFAGEQHGFRMAATIRRATQAEQYFYSRIFGFTPADELEPVTIENF